MRRINCRWFHVYRDRLSEGGFFLRLWLSHVLGFGIRHTLHSFEQLKSPYVGVKPKLSLHTVKQSLGPLRAAWRVFNLAQAVLF